MGFGKGGAGGPGLGDVPTVEDEGSRNDIQIITDDVNGPINQKEIVPSKLGLGIIPNGTLVGFEGGFGFLLDGKIERIDDGTQLTTNTLNVQSYYFTGTGGSGRPPSDPGLPLTNPNGPPTPVVPGTARIDIVIGPQEAARMRLNRVPINFPGGVMATEAQLAASLADFRQVGAAREIIAYQSTDTILVIAPQTPGQVNVSMTVISASDPNAGRYAANARARGCVVTTVGRMRAALSGIVAPTASEIRAAGSSVTMVNGAARAGSLATRWGASRVVGGLFLSTGITAGFAVLDWLNAQPDGIIYRQGRLQVQNRIAVEIADTEGIRSRIYYTPLNIDSPGRAQITIQRQAEVAQWRISDTQGNVPFLDLTQDNPVTDLISLDRTLIGNYHQRIIPGRPFDIFMMAPAVVTHAFQPGASYGSFFADIGAVLNPPVRANESFIAVRPDQLPRMFWLNWKTGTQRRTDRVGHYLVWDAVQGLCLGTPSGVAGSPVNTLCPDGGEGYFVGDSQIGPAKYIYLGTAIALQGGLVVNLPGCRLSWNMYNRLPYNDFRASYQRFYSVNPGRRLAVPEPMQLDPLIPDMWHHYYVNPTGQAGNPWYFTHPTNGRLKLGICGPLVISVIHQTNRNNMVDGSPVIGNNNCSYKDVIFSNLSRPEADIPAGLNDVEVVSSSILSPLNKQYCYLGTGDDHYLYDPAFGAVCSTDDPDAEAIQEVYEDDLIQDECADPAGTLRGWGMRGDC